MDGHASCHSQSVTNTINSYFIHNHHFCFQNTCLIQWCPHRNIWTKWSPINHSGCPWSSGRFSCLDSAPSSSVFGDHLTIYGLNLCCFSLICVTGGLKFEWTVVHGVVSLNLENKCSTWLKEVYTCLISPRHGSSELGTCSTNVMEIDGCVKEMGFQGRLTRACMSLKGKQNKTKQNPPWPVWTKNVRSHHNTLDTSSSSCNGLEGHLMGSSGSARHSQMLDHRWRRETTRKQPWNCTWKWSSAA